MTVSDSFATVLDYMRDDSELVGADMVLERLLMI